MALQSSGAISLANLATEFPDSTPYSLSEFYRGGGKVPNAAGNSAVPTSGAISLGNFYGAVNRVAINITISANQTNYVLNTAKASGYVAGVSDITLTINSGIYVSSNTTGGYGLDIDTSWNAGDTVTIVNNGFIVGRGGNGGNADTLGSAGGPAFRAQRSATVQNNGTIAGGGGGGGGGSTGSSMANKNTYEYFCGGGGGGGGRSNPASSSSGGVTSQPQGAYGHASGSWAPGGTGGSGTSSTAGTGGAGGTMVGGYGGNGGGGGAWGANGGTGARSSSTTATRAGGSGGASVAGNSNITWTATGTRLGAIA